MLLHITSFSIHKMCFIFAALSCHHRMKISWKFKPFNDLTAHELHDFLQIRQQVFIVEQNCPYSDIDKTDKLSFHLMALANQQTVGYARIIPPGVLYDEVSIGRIVTHQQLRRTGLGKLVVEKALDECRSLFPNSPIKIMAQSYLCKFYESFGFTVISEEFMEDNIPHIYMFRT